MHMYNPSWMQILTSKCWILGVNLKSCSVPLPPLPVLRVLILHTTPPGKALLVVFMLLDTA